MIPDIPSQGMTLVLGGVRSGKSNFVEETARESGKSVLFVATASAGDEEMAERIRLHQASRPASWQTLEAPYDLGLRVGATPVADIVIVDCITLLVNNLIASLPEDSPTVKIMDKIRIEIDNLIATHIRTGGQWLLVSNEVGLGVVPPYPLGRLYRDALGWTNQALAGAAKRVIYMIAGIPMVIK